MTISRGLTLIELLASLTLLSALALGVAAWTDVSAQLTVETVQPIRWDLSARNVLSLIRDDLATGDMSTSDHRRSTGTHRVTIDEAGTLVIHTRARTSGNATHQLSGPCTHEYRFNHDLRTLTLVTQPEHASGSTGSRLLLDDVHHWKCELTSIAGTNDEAPMNGKQRYDALVVRLTSSTGRTHKETYEWTRE